MQHRHHTTVRSTLLLFTVLAGLSSGFSRPAQADTIEKVRGKQAIIVFDDTEAKVTAGDKFFAMDSGKKKALLEVVKFKNGKAVVKILKGKAAEGMEIMASKSKAKPQDESSDEEQASADDTNSEEPSPKKKAPRSAGAATLFKDMTIGLLGGYSMDTQTISSPVSASMTGSGFSVKGFADVPVSGGLALYARAGAEQFNAQGSTYKTEILYAALDLMLKYDFGEGSMHPFAMGGLGLHFPVSKSSNILDVNRISSTTVFYAGGGINFVMSGNSYIQLTGEYGMFPPSNDVSTSLIAARAGMGFRF